MRSLLRVAHWILYCQLSFVGLKRIGNVIRGVPRYLNGLRQFTKSYRGKIIKLPCLADWQEESGNTRGEYFWQDLYVARKIFEASPRRHIDIGSRVDGFVAHVASYREIEVLDLRVNTATIPGVIFRIADLMDESTVELGCCDSISCLHALEHFGLGRYGDRVNVDGWRVGLRNMARMLRPGGVFYLAVPSGQPCVYFNAHRVFSPWEIRHEAEVCSLRLSEFATCDPIHGVQVQRDVLHSFHDVEAKPYTLCIYKFQVA